MRLDEVLKDSCFNEAAGIHRRKRLDIMLGDQIAAPAASMRPPEFTGGNKELTAAAGAVGAKCASMRPPEFTGGNACAPAPPTPAVTRRFNEAAGIHRRKRAMVRSRGHGFMLPEPRFNEAAGIHRRKPPTCGGHGCAEADGASMRPPEFTGGNEVQALPAIKRRSRYHGASMRPPEFTGGNSSAGSRRVDCVQSFIASMRPPEFTGGNWTRDGD